MTAITFYIAPGPINPLRWVTMGAAMLVTVVTGLDYLARAWRLHRQAVAARP